MTGNIAYSTLHNFRCMYPSKYNFFLLVIFLLFFIPQFNIYGQDEYDEISVFIEIPKIGGSEIDAVIKGTELFLPVKNLFDFLKIKNNPSQDLESITGFFITPDAPFNISRTENKITYQSNTYNLEPGDLVRTESNLYLRSSYFGKVFGLECIFNFRSLSVMINTRLELPLIREMRLEEMRKNLTRLKGELKADTAIGRSYPLFKFGMADWSVNANEEIKGKSDVRLSLALGAMIAGGETNASLYYSSTEPFNEKQQNYLWRYVNNDFSPLRQVMAGKINSNSISTIYNPVVGIVLTNTPTTYRRSFGSYTLSDRTEPGWIVELYVNNVLVDYVKADASGFFTFKVPLVYGNTIVKLKFYGPWGEERIREQYISIPFNFLPEKTFEYTASAGIVEDTLMSRFSRVNINYGLSRNLTLGGGVEYLSSVVSRPAMPFMNASLRITNNMLLSGEYTYGVRAKGTFSFSLPSNLQLDLFYTWYDKNQKAISFTYREERKATLSIPIKISKISTYQRLSFYQIVLPFSKYSTGEWLFTGSLYGVSTNITTYGVFNSGFDPYVYGKLALAFQLPAGFVVMPDIQYGYTQHRFISSKLRVEKRFMDHAFFNLSLEKNFISNINYGEVGLRYDFRFAQTGMSVRRSDRKTSFVQYARGSIINDKESGYLGTDNRTNVGKGAISVTAFIDINSNGRRDQGEPKVNGLNIRAMGGRVEKSERDSTIRIFGLEAYTNTFIELDPGSFDNLSWRLPYQTMNVSVDPNILKNIQIPINVVGEATGNIALIKDRETEGIGRIIVSFYSSAHKLAGKTLSEDDGYFTYFGLAPGKYSVQIDTGQLRKLNMRSEPDSIQFSIAAGIDGDIVNDLDFILSMKQGDTTGTKTLVPEKPVVRKDTAYLIVHEVTQELVTISEDSYAIQMGAFKNRRNAEQYRKKLEKILGKKVEIIIEDNFYKLRISDIKERKEVDEYISVLHQNGVNEVWVISLKAKKQLMVLTEKQDTIRKITESLIGKPELYGSEGITIQLGAFRDKSNAIALLKRLTERYGNRVFLIFNDGFYKLRLSGMPVIKQTVLDELNKLGPKLGNLKFKDIWMLPVVEPSEELPAVTERSEISLNKIVINLEIPLLARPDTIQSLITNKLVKPSTQPALSISIKVGAFNKKSEAMRAQRRITSKLKLNVEIVQQWDYYIVLIRGFHSREETYKYYPELAGLGYPGVSLVEE